MRIISSMFMRINYAHRKWLADRHQIDTGQLVHLLPEHRW